MKHKTTFLAGALVLAMALMIVTMVSMPGPEPAVAAIPTPVAEVAGGGDWVMVTYNDAYFVDASDTISSTSKHAPAYTAGDFTWTIDVSGTITVTCKLQWSNDNSNWADGVNIFANVLADATNADQFNMFCRYHRVYCTEVGGAADENTYTLTMMSKLIN